MSITTTVSRLNRAYLKNRTKDQLIELVELCVKECEYYHRFLCNQVEVWDDEKSEAFPLGELSVRLKNDEEGRLMPFSELLGEFRKSQGV